MLIGSPDQVADKVAGLEAIGVDTLLLVCSHDPATVSSAQRAPVRRRRSG